MSLFDLPDFDDHEAVTLASDDESGLKAILAIHSTVLGPALGGCRMWRYASDGDALVDALRLSRGMTYKAALADLPYGGGKSVILADPARGKTPDLMRAMGRAVERLGGRYLIAEDVGTTPEDMAQIARETDHVKGVAGRGFDPSPATAWGVFHGMKAAIRAGLGAADFKDIKIAVQGLGHVGMELCRLLHGAGARLIVADIDQARVDRAAADFGAATCPVAVIHQAEADVFAPCALGGGLNDETIPALRVRVVAGAANNQLLAPRHGQMLADLGILYAPDYVINAGGIIHIHHEGPDYDRAAAFAHVARIEAHADAVFALARQEGLDPASAADNLAKRKVAARRERQKAA